MQLTLLGTGTPTPTVLRQGSANLIQIGDRRLLVDAGRGATTQLARIGVAPDAIDHVFVTHHHFDHIGCLGDLLLAAWNSGRSEPIEVFGPDGTAAIVETLLTRVYARDIEFRLLEGHRFGAPMPDLRELVLPHDLAAGEVVQRDGWSMVAELVEHGHALGLSHADWPCLGYRFEAEGKVVAFSGDAIACEALDRLAAGADVLVHCCYLAEAAIESEVQRLLVDQVLAGSVQAGETAARGAVGKLILTHLAPMSPVALASIYDDVRRSFPGDVVVGEDLLSIAI